MRVFLKPKKSKRIEERLGAGVSGSALGLVSAGACCTFARTYLMLLIKRNAPANSASSFTVIVDLSAPGGVPSATGLCSPRRCAAAMGITRLLPQPCRAPRRRARFQGLAPLRGLPTPRTDPPAVNAKQGPFSPGGLCVHADVTAGIYQVATAASLLLPGREETRLSSLTCPEPAPRGGKPRRSTEAPLREPHRFP